MFTKIKYKLLLYFIVLGIVPLAVIMLMEYYKYVEGLKNRSFTQLKAVREIKKVEIENYFANTNKEISVLAQSQVVIEAMKGFKKSFHSISKKNLPVEYPDKLKKYYLEAFRKKVNIPDTNAIDFLSLVPTNPASIVLQVEYLDGNKSSLKSLPFHKVHEQYHNFFSDFIKTEGYYDLLLIDNETGDIVYSVEKEVDFATNLLDGPYANTNMGHLFKKLRNSGSGKQTTLCDFERYLPSYLSPASFIATPVFDGNKKIGTLVFQIPVDKLDAITINKKTWREEGLGETGECYIVGKDCRLRTNSRFIIEEPQQFFTTMEKNSYDKTQIDLMKYYNTTILFQAKCNNVISKSGNEQTGLAIAKDYRGVEVLSAYTRIDILDVNWFMMAEMDVSEVFASVYSYRLNSLIILGVVLIILIAVAFSIAKSIYKPINILVEGAKELGKGNLNIHLDIENKDEFGVLANAFNIGVSALKNNRNEVLENALTNERKLNEELAQREEELTSNEEELRQSLESQSDLLEEIQLKEASLAALINNTDDWIYSLDKDMRLIEFNEAVKTFYSKLGVELYKGIHVSDFIPEKNMEEATTAFKKVLQGESVIAVIKIVDLKGDTLFFESSNNSIRDKNKEVIGISVMIREITKRMKEQELLKASEEKFSKAFKSSPDAVIITSVHNGKIVELNEGFLTWSGYTREEIGNKTTLELGFWNPEEREQLKKELREHGKVVELEVHLKIKSGEVRDCLMSAETIELEGELCFVSITRDITDRKKNEELLIELLHSEKQLNHELSQREEELTSSEEELRQSLESQNDLLKEIQLKEISLSALINNTNDFIYSLDKDLNLVEFNNSVKEFYSKRGVELYKGKNAKDFLSKKNSEEAIAIFKKVLQGHSETAVIEVPDHTNGSTLFFESLHNPIRGENKEVIGVSIMIREVTERIKFVQALRSSEEKFSKAFKSSPDAVMITALKDSRIVDLNEGFLTWSGYTQSEVAGKTTMELGFWDPKERAYLKKHLEEHGKVNELEVHLKIKSGEVKDCLISAETIELDGELCLISITRDITIRKKNQELLIELLETEKKLNHELSQREEELSSSEEELRQSFESQSRLLEEIQLKEANVSALMNNTKDLIYSVDRELKLIEFNSSINLFFEGRGVHLYKGMHVSEFIYIKNIEGAVRTLRKAMQGEPCMYLFEVPNNNEVLHFESYYSPIINDSKEILGVSVVTRNITERIKAEDAVRTSEEKFSKGFRTSPDSIAITNLSEGKVIEVNDAFLTNLGFERKEVIGKTTAELGYMDDIQDRDRITELLIKNGRVNNFELRTHKKSGEKRTVLLSAEMLEVENQKCIITIARDITHLKKVEEEIRLTNERLKVVIDNIPVAIWTLDKEGIITFSEGKALGNMGLKPGENVGESIYELDRYHPNYIEYIDHVLKQGVTQRTDYVVKDCHYEDILSPILDNQNKIVGLIGVSYDVTELKKNEIKLIENEALLNNIIDHLPIGLQIFDDQGYSLKMNEAQSRLLGLKNREEGVGKFNALTDSVNAHIGMDKLFRKAFKGEIIENVELAIDFKALQDVRYGRTDLVWYNLWLFPLFNKEGKVQAIINLLADITERKLSEEKIEQKNEELIEVNKMMADYKLMALRSAMNPHFIFNAMNSIQYFISKNERENALVYLSLFSKLIRNILTGTLENKTTIHHEMETLQNYIELENLRFDMKFKVEYEIEESLDIRQMEIPSLLLQPYVENAILHGLYNKKGNGVLKIKILSHKENTIIFVVEDNGIGREEAKKIKMANQIHNHKSVGMVVTKERLDIINKTNKVSVKITDLSDKGEAMGTRIEIYVEI